MVVTSIIITTHNRPHLLGRAVESARTAGTAIELIVVDDASSDATASMCRALPGIKYVRLERNQRVAGARNIGLLASSGQYVTFLDDDDLRLPGSLDEQVQLLAANDQAGLVYGQAVVKDGSTEQVYPSSCPKGEVFWNLVAQNFIPCGSVVFRRSCLERVGLLDSYLAGLDDWDLWIRIASLYAVVVVEKPVLIWRRSTPVSEQGTSQAASIVSRAVQQFQSRWMKLPPAVSGTAEMRRSAWQQFSTNMAAHLIWETIRSLNHRDARQAARNISTVAGVGPIAVGRVARRYLQLRSAERNVI
jgi:hypothetical protein